MSKFKLGPNQKKWLKALRSGKYTQCQNTLFDGDSHCCLGVACEIMGLKPKERTDKLSGYSNGYYYLNSNGSLPTITTRQLKLRTKNGDPKDQYIDQNEDLTSLLELNDDFRKSFEEIADILEQNPEQYFTGPA